MENVNIDKKVSTDYEIVRNEYDIFAEIERLGKAHILFDPEGIKSTKDIQLYSQTLLNRSILGASMNALESFTVRYTSEEEKEACLEAKKKGTTNIEEETVRYTISPLGYRLTNPLDSIHRSTGIFGCSITYGIGIPEDQTFSHLLQENLKTPVHNFGIPGGSIQKIRKSFISINNYYKLETAILVLPSMSRFEFIGKEPVDKVDTLYSEGYVPAFNPINPARRGFYEALYTYYQDITFFDEFSKNLQLIKLNAQINGTKLYLFTWDYVLLNLATHYKITGLENSPLVRFIENDELQRGEKVVDFARDGMHPGLRSQKSITDLILRKLGKGNLI